jgi:dTMP kinase
MRTRDGFFLTLEGPEGGGKTTQAKRLEDHLRRRGYDVLLTREPGGTKLGEEIRRIFSSKGYTISPEAELLLLLSSRAQHVREVIAKSLEQKKVVICDRFSDATLAYQGYGRGMDISFIKMLNDFATSGLRPDLTILLDLDVEVGLRRKGISEDRMEAEDISFHERVRKGYLSIALEEPERVKVLDASRDEDSVFRDLLVIVLEAIRRKG